MWMKIDLFSKPEMNQNYADQADWKKSFRIAGLDKRLTALVDHYIIAKHLGCLK